MTTKEGENIEGRKRRNPLAHGREAWAKRRRRKKKVTALLLIRKRGGKGRWLRVVGTTLAVRSQFAVCSLLSAARQIAPFPLPPPSLFLCSCFLSRAREIYLAKNFCTLVRTSFFLFRGRNIDTGEERERDRRREISLRWLRAIFQDFG